MADLDLMDERTRLALRAGHAQTVGPGEVVVEEGTRPTRLYVVEEGEVTITVRHPEGERELHRLGPGDVFGEVSFVDRGPASASCRGAQAGATLRHLDRSELEQLVRTDSARAAEVFRAVALVLAARLRRITPPASRAAEPD